ncbi:MAG: hypothetical protein WCF36_04010 [Candidatus Nanopelagicales bacterium]
MKIKPAAFRVDPGSEVDQTHRPTIGEPLCASKKEYKKRLKAHVAH